MPRPAPHGLYMKRAPPAHVRIDDEPDPDYEPASIIGCRPDDEYASKGRIVFQAGGGSQFTMKVCTGELLHHIAEFVRRNRGGGEGGAAGATAGDDATPTIYRMIEEICEAQGLVLVRAEIDDGREPGAARQGGGERPRDGAAPGESRSWTASLYMTGGRGGGGLVLRGYRAPDATALASLYNAPILVRRSIVGRAARRQVESAPDPDYAEVRIAGVGFVDRRRIGGLVVFETGDGKQFPMTAFTGEVAGLIGEYAGDDRSCGEDLPTVYRMVEHICSSCGLALERVRIYESGQVMRANLYLAGKPVDGGEGGSGVGKEDEEGEEGEDEEGRGMVLRNYRASDATALASLYDVPILVSRSIIDRAPSVSDEDGRE